MFNFPFHCCSWWITWFYNCFQHRFSTNAKIRTSFYEGGYTKANVQLSELDAVLKGLFTDPEEHATVKKAIFDHSVRRDERYTNNKSLYMDLKNDVVVLQDIYNKLGIILTMQWTPSCPVLFHVCNCNCYFHSPSFQVQVVPGLVPKS